MRSNALAQLPHTYFCANACLKHSKLLMSADNHLLRCLAVLRVGVFERCAHMGSMNRDRQPLRCKYACARALLRMPISKRRRINREIQSGFRRVAYFAVKRHDAM